MGLPIVPLLNAIFYVPCQSPLYLEAVLCPLGQIPLLPLPFLSFISPSFSFHVFASYPLPPASLGQIHLLCAENFVLRCLVPSCIAGEPVMVRDPRLSTSPGLRHKQVPLDVTVKHWSGKESLPAKLPPRTHTPT